VTALERKTFFEEEYSVTNNQGQDSISIKSSRLMSQEEVITIGIENFTCTNQPLSRSSSTTYNSRGRLDITFVMANLTLSGYESAYSLTAYSSWDGMPLFPGLGGSNDPGYGEDYMGFTWGGEYDYYNESASATREILGAQNVYYADSLPNSGVVWSFEEFNYYQGVGYDYVTDATCSCNIRKAHLTGGGNTTSAVFKYIHTYQNHSGSISISAGAGGLSASYSLSGVSNQWSLVCTFNSMPY